MKWYAERLQTYLLPAFQEASTEEEIKMVCQNEIAFWMEKYPDKPNSWKTPHTQSRNFVRQADLDEQKRAWILQYLRLADETWTDADKANSESLAVRLESQLFLKQPDQVVEQADALLTSDRWQDIAAGLLLATGRRATEILKTAQFEPSTAYSVVFSGQIKHHVNPFEIVTLCPAEKVIGALARLRDVLDTEEMTEHQVSNAFHRTLGKSVKTHFQEIIPARDGEEISPQVLRSVYLRLAIFFYAPVNVDAETFAAEISGHRKKGKASETDPDERSYGAAPHYAEYKLVDSKGQIDGRQGVKLSEPGVEVLAVFSQGARVIKGAYKPARTSAVALTPESLFTGEDLKTVQEGMAAANMVDFVAYIKMALKRQARTDLGMARRDTLADVASMSMDDLARVRKPAAAAERFRRSVASLNAYNDTHVQAERWFINNTLVRQHVGGNFNAITAYLNEHAAEVKAMNARYNLDPSYNRKPTNVKDVVPVE
jgi:hypothetical protein